MKGYLLLSEVRSGTNWLASFANATGAMGNCREWLGQEHFDRPLRDMSAEEFSARVFANAATGNGRFAIKIFPRHLHYVRHKLGFDFLRRCLEEHETTIVHLSRRDRLKHAISLVRSLQTQQWTSDKQKQREEWYNFDFLCRAYFYLGQGQTYWESYLGMLDLPHEAAVYEDLLDDPLPLLEGLRARLDVEVPFEMKTELKIQRDAVTEQWVERFRQDLLTRDVVGPSGHEPAPEPSLSNLWKMLRRQPLRIPYNSGI